MEITHLHPILLAFLVLLLVLGRYGFEKAISRVFKSFKIERTGIHLITRGFILVFFNIAVLALCGLLRSELFALSKPKTGGILLAIGLGFGVIMALLSLLAVRAGFGGGYSSLASVSSLDKCLTLATFLLLSGPSEDIFFIGLIQNVFTSTLGWGAIVIYLVLFVFYHYANVISGVECKKEFLGTLPVRLLVSLLPSLGFYLTGTLVYGMIVHNLVDLVSYLALLYAVRPKPA